MNDKRPYKAPRRLWRGRWCIPPPLRCAAFPPPWAVEETDACFIVGGRFVVKRAASPRRQS